MLLTKECSLGLREKGNEFNRMRILWSSYIPHNPDAGGWVDIMMKLSFEDAVTVLLCSNLEWLEKVTQKVA